MMLTYEHAHTHIRFPVVMQHDAHEAVTDNAEGEGSARQTTGHGRIGETNSQHPINRHVFNGVG